MRTLLRWFWRMFPGVRSAFASKAVEAVVADPRFVASAREAFLSDPRAAAKFYPHRADQSSYAVEASAERSSDSALPVPPKNLWMGHQGDEEIYFAIGRGYIHQMKGILEAANAPLASHRRILDFGCSSGIMLRWLRDHTKDGEVWGVDISGDHMIWCQRHLSPPFKFATTTSFPHLPFEDNYFDLVYAGSVFTHIADLAEAWLLELRRITRPGGKLFLTIQDEGALQLYLEDPEHTLGKRLRDNPLVAQLTRAPYDFFTIDRIPGAGAPGEVQIFYRREYLVRHWSNYLKVISAVPKGYHYQTAVLLEKIKSSSLR